jgi:hypothetical protein
MRWSVARSFLSQINGFYCDSESTNDSTQENRIPNNSVTIRKSKLKSYQEILEALAQFAFRELVFKFH